MQTTMASDMNDGIVFVKKKQFAVMKPRHKAKDLSFKPKAKSPLGLINHAST